MKPGMKRLAAALIGVLTLISSIVRADPLPSWNDTAPKKANITFVEKVTTSSLLVPNTYKPPFLFTGTIEEVRVEPR